MRASLLDLGVTWFWPHEPIRADQSDRSDKFGICTVPASLAIAGLPTSEAVFILDFVTGRLQGFYLNPQQGGFSQMFYRDIADDLRLNAKGCRPAGLRVRWRPGPVFRARDEWGASIIYVAEMHSGKLVAYAFPFSQANAGQPQQMVPVANAQFRAAAGELNVAALVLRVLERRPGGLSPAERRQTTARARPSIRAKIRTAATRAGQRKRRRSPSMSIGILRHMISREPTSAVAKVVSNFPFIVWQLGHHLEGLSHMRVGDRVAGEVFFRVVESVQFLTDCVEIDQSGPHERGIRINQVSPERGDEGRRAQRVARQALAARKCSGPPKPGLGEFAKPDRRLFAFTLEAHQLDLRKGKFPAEIRRRAGLDGAPAKFLGELRQGFEIGRSFFQLERPATTSRCTTARAPGRRSGSMCNRPPRSAIVSILAHKTAKCPAVS